MAQDVGVKNIHTTTGCDNLIGPYIFNLDLRHAIFVRNRRSCGGQRTRERGRFGFCLRVFCLWTMLLSVGGTSSTPPSAASVLLMKSAWQYSRLHHIYSDLVMLAAGPSLQQNNAVNVGLSWPVALNFSPGRLYPCPRPSSLKEARGAWHISARSWDCQPPARKRINAFTPIRHCQSQEQPCPNADCLVSKENNISTKDIFSVYEAFNIKQRKWKKCFFKK